MTGDILARLGVTSSKPLGQEYHWVQLADPAALHTSPAAIFLRWNLPVHHAWPCHPQKMEGFIEKAAQALHRKFAALEPQALLAGALEAGGPAGQYHRQLASNLRGRALQLFPHVASLGLEADTQDPDLPTLYCLVGRQGLYAGLQSARLCHGQHPGGTRFIATDARNTISRAGAKVAEALHHLLMHRQAPPAGSHWLELGASPGGMTSELLDRDYRVTAVDRAPLDVRLKGRRGLRFERADVATWQPEGVMAYDAMLCDLNGEASASFRQVARLSPWLRPGGLVIFTLKLPDAVSVASILDRVRDIHGAAAQAGFALVAQGHLSYNRHEFTLFLEKTGAAPSGQSQPPARPEQERSRTRRPI